MSAKKKKIQAHGSAASQCIRLELIWPDAQKVCIAGSFMIVTPMIHGQDGRWVKKLELRPGRYEYRFVVDGKWSSDPTAKQEVPNPFGGKNAVLIVNNQ